MAEPHRLDAALGLRIRQRRKSLGISQSALSDAVGLTFQQIQKYERGSNRVSFSRLVEIARALECAVLDLIGDMDDPALAPPLEDQHTKYLRIAGAPELVTAYARITGPLRRAILKLVVALAKEYGGRPEPEDLEQQQH